MPAAPHAHASANQPENSTDQADDESAVFTRLTPLLARFGLDADVLQRDGRPTLLLVSNGGRPATYVYVATNRLLQGPAVYGFVDLYLGQVADLERVAARLAWLLGALIPNTPSPDPVREK